MKEFRFGLDWLEKYYDELEALFGISLDNATIITISADPQFISIEVYKGEYRRETYGFSYRLDKKRFDKCTKLISDMFDWDLSYVEEFTLEVSSVGPTRLTTIQLSPERKQEERDE